MDRTNSADESSRIILELQERLKLQELVTKISAIFMNLPAEEIDEQIENGLKCVVEFLGIDRSGMGEFDENGDPIVSHFYCVPGVPPLPIVNIKKVFPWFGGKIVRGEIVNLENASDLPPEAVAEKAYVEKTGMKSNLMIPFSVAGAMLCGISFTSFNSYRFWPDPLVQQLKQVGEIFANAIYRKRSEQKIKDQLDKLTKSFEEIRQLKNRLEAEANYLRSEITLNHRFENIIGESNAFRMVLTHVEQVAPTDSAVLILGETGTGKEGIARAVHDLSVRKARPMVKVDCASLPSALIESELFGREKGAYTGALTKQVGRFDVANDSTIFLDEIGELPLELQTKLLRVLEYGEFERLGSPNTIKVNVRIIAATNRDLRKAIQNRTFREDLFYRLNVFPIHIPPLRDRIDDLPLLVQSFLNEFNIKMGKNIRRISKDSMELLKRHNWPGNIRELRNIVEQAVIISNGETLQIPLDKYAPTVTTELLRLDQLESKHIFEILEKTHWQIKGRNGAAQILGLNPSTLYSKMKKLGITPADRKPGAHTK